MTEADPTARRFAVDATCLASRRGYGRYLRELLPRLRACDPRTEYVPVLDRRTAAAGGDLAAGALLVETRESQMAAASATGNRRVGDLLAMRRGVALAAPDLVFFPSLHSYFPVARPTPVVITIHDAIPERHPAAVFPTRRGRWLWRLKVSLALRRAVAILTVSEWSRRAIVAELGVPEGRVTAVPEAPAELFRPEPDPSTARRWLAGRELPADVPFFLYVGGFGPHKNLPAAVRALARAAAAADGRSPLFLLAGDADSDPFHRDLDALRGTVDEVGLTGRVVLLGHVDDELLRHLYGAALALVLPSLEEGFGLPAIEAAACGTPCVATDRSPLPALLPGGGLFIDPGDESALAAALGRFLSGEVDREALAARALEGAGRLSWQQTALATRDALHRAAGATGPLR